MEESAFYGRNKAKINFNAKKLVERRKAKGLSQEEVAQYAGISPGCYSMLEKGSRKPLAETLARIARALKTKQEYFFNS